jgi:SAM-dependent methyltransferase
MASFEDHFSEQAGEYAAYRPGYPDALFAYLASLAPQRELAWDVGTGSGQAARSLRRYFRRVYATDASAEQIARSLPGEQVEFRVERAEDVGLPDSSVDLITAATAVHWFDLEPFYRVVRRVGKPGGVLAVWTYHLPDIEPTVNDILLHYYAEILKDCWPERFHYVDERYQTLPFPFDEIQPPLIRMQTDWNLDQVAGFLDSWSSTRRYLKEHGRHPLSLVWEALSQAWGDPKKPRTLRWPLFLRVGRIGSEAGE